MNSKYTSVVIGVLSGVILAMVIGWLTFFTIPEKVISIERRLLEHEKHINVLNSSITSVKDEQLKRTSAVADVPSLRLAVEQLKNNISEMSYTKAEISNLASEVKGLRKEFAEAIARAERYYMGARRQQLPGELQ